MDFQELINWSKNKGAFIDCDLELKEIEEGNRSLITKQDIPKDHIIIKYPKKYGIPVKNNMILDLLSEMIKGEQSEFSTYLTLLPKSVNLPKFTNEDYEGFEKSYPELYLMIQRTRTIIKALYEHISKLDIDEKYKSRDFVEYLYNLYRTRAWSEWGFLPLLDFFQHDNEPNLRINAKEEDDCIMVSALRDIKAGEELTHRYSVYSPLTLYYNYGIEEMFDKNFFRFKYNQSTFILSDDYLDIKKQLPALMVFIRKQELDFENNDISCDKPFSIENEFRTIKKLKQILNLRYVNNTFGNKHLDNIKNHTNNTINTCNYILDKMWLSLI